jgi:hypothetical protein
MLLLQGVGAQGRFVVGVQAVKRHRRRVGLFGADPFQGTGKFRRLRLVHIEPAVKKARYPAVAGVANQKNLAVVVGEGLRGGVARPSVHLGAAVQNFDERGVLVRPHHAVQPVELSVFEAVGLKHFAQRTLGAERLRKQRKPISSAASRHSKQNGAHGG